jgi:hypothetical protein
MAKTIVGYFDDLTQAERGVRALVDGGFSRDDISLIASDPKGEYGKYGMATPASGEPSDSGVVIGASTGAILGGLGGLLVGLGALAIPGIGPIVAAGPLGATLLGVGIGTTTGGIIGTLTDIGVAEEEAGYYAEGLRRGGVVVAVRIDGLMADRAADMLRRQGAVDIDQRIAEWRHSGWTGYDPNAEPPYTEYVTQAPDTPSPPHTSASDFERYAADFRNHCTTTYASRGYTYAHYEPAYRYGYTLANDERYSGKSWKAIEVDARRGWERRNQGVWDDFQDAIRYAWSRVQGYRTSRAA